MKIRERKIPCGLERVMVEEEEEEEGKMKRLGWFVLGSVKMLMMQKQWWEDEENGYATLHVVYIFHIINYTFI